MRVTVALAIMGFVRDGSAPGLSRRSRISSSRQARPDNKKFGPRVQQVASRRPAGQQGPAPTMVSTHGDWKIQCENNPRRPSPSGQPPNNAAWCRPRKMKKNRKRS